MIDGVAISTPSIVAYKLDELLHHATMAAYATHNGPIVFNLDTWKKLPEDVRKHLLAIAPGFEEKCAKHHVKLRKEYRKLYQASGVKFIKFSPNDAKKFISTIYEATKNEYLKKTGEEGSKLLKLVTK